MITADAHPATSPVMLTYWVSGRYSPERLLFREMDSWAEEHRVELRCGERATAVDVQRQAVTLSGGEISALRPAPRRHRGDPRHPADPRHRGQGGLPLSDPRRRRGDPDLPPRAGASLHHGGRFHRVEIGLPPPGARHRGQPFSKRSRASPPGSSTSGPPQSSGSTSQSRSDGRDRDRDRRNFVARRLGIRRASGGRQDVRSPDPRRRGGCAAEHRASRRRARGSARDDPGGDPGQRTDGDRPSPHVTRRAMRHRRRIRSPLRPSTTPSGPPRRGRARWRAPTWPAGADVRPQFQPERHEPLRPAGGVRGPSLRTGGRGDSGFSGGER